MKNTVKIVGVMAMTIFLMASCATKQPFTEPVRKKYGLKDDILPKLQFFVSKDIVIYRANSEAGLAIENGEVVVSSTNEEDELIIKKGTKGAFVALEGSDKISIRFEMGENKFLIFSTEGTYKGRYHLVAKWERKRGVLNYNKEKYYVTPESNSAYLMFKLKHLNRYKKKSRVASGVDVG